MIAKYEVIIYPLAKKDIQDIYKYIYYELRNVIAANKLMERLKEKMENLRFFPLSFPVVDNEYIKYKGIRKVIVDSYIIFFRVYDKEVQILRVIYSKINYKGIIINGILDEKIWFIFDFLIWITYTNSARYKSRIANLSLIS